MSPKTIERQRRDAQAKGDSHEHATFESSIPSASKWNSMLKYRQCKHNLTTQLALMMLQLVQPYLSPGKRFFTAGSLRDELRDCVLFCQFGQSIPQIDERFTCNIEEADMRVCLHCKNAAGSRKIIISPDTDTYHVGMGLLEDVRLSECDIYVQVSRLGDSVHRYLHLSGLYGALQLDQSLSLLPTNIRLQALQTLYVCTGCDYLSYFYQIGKAKFLQVFFQFASFITSGLGHYPGTLADITPPNDSKGYLAFIRLVGCVYFKQNTRAFQHPSPVAHFKSLSQTTSALEYHLQWLDEVRKKIWSRAKSVANEVPSGDALQYHWKRSIWVLHMWKQSLCNSVQLLPMDEYGWTVKSGRLDITWESENNVRRVESHMKYLLDGCHCKKGDCSNRQCGCVKFCRGNCGPACTCDPQKCMNRTMNRTVEESDKGSDDESEEDSDDENEEHSDHENEQGSDKDSDIESDGTCSRYGKELGLEVEQIMADVFGELNSSDILL